ncbi:MAG TPA: GNAT family N-acetyltransferase [Chloroflexota bacterium]|nr:GNAT family N-acetyltransferase [Chloroflexota bacterium]
MDVRIRPAIAEDVTGIAAIFGRAFDDYRAGFGVDARTLASLWEGSLSARITSTTVATLADGRLGGFVVTVKPGETERYGDRRSSRRRLAAMRAGLGWSMLWRPMLLFLPMGLAHARRHTRSDEFYISLVGVDPDVQGRGIGQALLAAAEEQARAAGASAILLHTAANNTRARAAYTRSGYALVSTVRAPWRGPANIAAYVALRKPLRPDPTPRLDALPQSNVSVP